jgi:hypothetical protein
VLLILFPYGADFRKGGRAECADLRWPSGLSFRQEVDDSPFTHVALHA